MTNPYKILGVTPAATAEDIKKAYRNKARECHPDKNPDDPNSTSAFQTLQRAYDLLKDPEKRRHYDETGMEYEGPPLDEAANNHIAQLYLEIAERAKYAPGDYLTDVRKSIQNSLRQCVSTKVNNDRDSTLLRYLIENIAADEMMLAHLNGKLSRFKHDNARLLEVIKLMNRALELLDGYKYTGSVPVTPPSSRAWEALWPSAWGDIPHVGL